MSVPICEDSTVGSPTRIAFARVASSSQTSSYFEAWTRILEPATQLWPLLTKFEWSTDGSTVVRSASGRTIDGLLPPSSRITGTTFFAVDPMTDRPAAGPPVKAIIPMPGCSVSIGPTTSPRPVSTLTTPGGIPTSRASSAYR